MRFVTIMSFLNTHFLQLQQQINHIYTLIYNKYRQLLYAEYFLKNEALKTTTKVWIWKFERILYEDLKLNLYMGKIGL